MGSRSSYVNLIYPDLNSVLVYIEILQHKGRIVSNMFIEAQLSVYVYAHLLMGIYHFGGYVYRKRLDARGFYMEDIICVLGQYFARFAWKIEGHPVYVFGYKTVFFVVC